MVPGPGEWFCHRHTLQRGKLETVLPLPPNECLQGSVTTGSICIMLLQEEQKKRRVSVKITWVLVALLERGCQAVVLKDRRSCC